MDVEDMGFSAHFSAFFCYCLSPEPQPVHHNCDCPKSREQPRKRFPKLLFFQLNGEILSSGKLSISFSVLSLPEMFSRMSKFENIITQARKTKVDEKSNSYSFSFDIIDWEMTLFAQRQEKVKSLLRCVITEA